MFNNKLITLTPYKTSNRFSQDDNNNWIFLDWNESNHPLPSFIHDSIYDSLSSGIGVSYPDGDSLVVTSSIAKYVDLEDSNILVFNGSDSALKICIESVLSIEDELSIIEPEYSQIDTFVHMASATVDRVKVDDPFNINIDDLILRIKNKKFLYISNPSNPTGRFFEPVEIKKILETGIILLLDEAYIEFAKNSCSHFVRDYKNLFIFRTFSKSFGLAGFRLGYLLSHKENISLLIKVRNSKEVNAFSQVAAISALNNLDYYTGLVDEILLERDSFIEFVNSLNFPIKAFNSFGNFVVIRTPLVGNLIDYLKTNKILIRDRRGMFFMDNSARISIGRPDQMNLLKNCIRNFFEKSEF